MCAGVGRVEDLAAGVGLSRTVVADHRRLSLPGPEWAAETATGAPGQVHQCGGIGGHLKAGEAICEFGGNGGEGLGA